MDEGVRREEGEGDGERIGGQGGCEGSEGSLVVHFSLNASTPAFSYIDSRWFMRK